MNRKPLDRKDIQYIEKEIKNTNRVGFTASFAWVFFAQSGLFIENVIFLYVELAALIGALLIILLTKKANQNKNRELVLGYKIIEKYPIKDKVDFPDDEPGVGGKTHKYYLVARNNKHFLDKEFYEKASLNDYLVLHLSPIREYIIARELEKRIVT
jgi:hypothetical protein